MKTVIFYISLFTVFCVSQLSIASTTYYSDGSWGSTSDSGYTYYSDGSWSYTN